MAGRPPQCSQERAVFSRIFFPSDTITTAAVASGSFERIRAIKPQAFVEAVAFATADATGRLDVQATLAVMGHTVSSQAVSDKLAKPQTEDFFAALTKIALARSASLPRIGAIAIRGVGDIHLADSSIIALAPPLANVLPGTGGDGPIAAAKLHATFNLTTGQFSYLALTPGTTSDHFAKDTHLAVTKAGDLILRDLGYWDAEDLARIREQQRYFISRIPLSVAHFADESGAFDLWADLANQRSHVHEYVLTVGKGGIQVRVIAIRLPRAAAQKRAKDTAKEKGRALTTSEAAQAKWNIYATF